MVSTTRLVSWLAASWWAAVLAAAPVDAQVTSPGAAGTDQDQRPPNIIWIMADDLGYGDLGCYGQRAIETPRLDAMAREGLRFTQFYAGSTVCAPSRCAFITGLHTGHCLIRGNAKDNLRPEDVTIAEVLKTAGYTCGLAGKWGLGHEGSLGVPNHQGFDLFYGYLDQTHAHNYYPTFLMHNLERVALRNVVPREGRVGQGVASQKVDYSARLIADQALEFVRQQHQRGPFFLYWAVTLPHANNEAGDEGMEVPSVERYADRQWPASEKGHAAMISYLDDTVGEMLDLLTMLGIDQQTVVFFSSDNGPHREGGHDPEFHDSNGPLRGTKRSLHDGGIRVPLLARWPGHIPAGAQSDWVGANWDALPTLAELAGASAAVPPRHDGVSFVPTLLGRPQDQRSHDYLYWAFYEQRGGRAIRAGNWKGIEQPIGSPLRIYDLSRDVGEDHDVAAEHPALAQVLLQLMQGADEPSTVWRWGVRLEPRGGR